MIRDHIYKTARRLIKDDSIDCTSSGRIKIEKKYDENQFEGLEVLLEIADIHIKDLQKLKKES